MSIRPSFRLALAIAASCTFAAAAQAQEPSQPPAPVVLQTPGYDAALAKKLGADEHGMRSYVLVILKTGPTPVPKGPKRDEMFAGHFANMERLAAEGKLAVAGPFSKDPDGWRGMFVFAVDNVDEARALAETDPVLINGEMVAEYHPWYGSAALMGTNEVHGRITAPAHK